MAQAVEAFPEDEPLLLSDPAPGSSQPEMTDLDVPEAEIDWVDEAPTEPEIKPAVKSTEPAPRPRPKPASGPARPARPSVAPAPRPKPSAPAPITPMIRIEPRPTLLEWASAHRNALLVVAVLVLILGAIGIRSRRQRLEELPQIAEIGRLDGMKKLDAGDFQAAKQLLGDAASAVEGLGGQYEGADAIRQGALEAAIFADLAPAGLDEILEQAGSGDKDLWPARFASTYKGRSVILDPPISEVPDPAKPGSAYKVNFPLYSGRGPKPGERARIDLTGFRLFELAQPRVDEQKPFGARYESIVFDVEANLWVVKFTADSGVFITHPKALEAINWPTSGLAEEPTP